MEKTALEILKYIAKDKWGIFFFVILICLFATINIFTNFIAKDFLNMKVIDYIYISMLISFLFVFFSFIKALRDKDSKEEKNNHTSENLIINKKLNMHEQLLNTNGKLDEDELSRLSIQGNRNYNQDISIITGILKILKRKDVSLLDIGCGDGTITMSRMNNFKNITKVIGIDKNNEVINKANRNNINTTKYQFRTYDIEYADFTHIGELSENDDNKFDIVFCSLVLPHILDPYQLVVNIKTVLNSGGVVIFRSSDDGTKICYPRPKTLQSILDYTQKIPGISDRYNARKVLSYLKSADFSNISSSYDIIDTIGKTAEERKTLFHKSFSFRQKYLNKTILKNIKVDFSKHEFDKLLKELENSFIDPSFYYMEISYIFTAQLK